MKPLLKTAKNKYREGDLKTLAKLIPHLRGSRSKFVNFLLESNLLRMQQHLGDRPITLGADPEFILAEKKHPDKIVLFSSKYTTDYFGISEAEVGADYGLLEFRPEPASTPDRLVESLKELYTQFSETYPDFLILEKEAIEYDHKKARVLEALSDDNKINYGMNRGKDLGVWGASSEISLGIETGMSLSAYDQPIFCQFNDKLFTAGGHLHLGGSLIMMLSIDQLKALVRKLDAHVLPICKEVETKAGELRRSVYGSQGEFRLKNYGIEYRSPSNAIFWNRNISKLNEVLEKTVDIIKNMAFN